jgi:hypothetical protein
MQPLHESDAEKASNGYLMSLIALMAGMPLPIVNLLASIGFYLGNRKSNYFVRWHCTQAMVSQLLLFWWTVSIVFTSRTIDSAYVGYVLTLLIFNLFEFIATMRTAILTRKGQHVEWWLAGGITHLLCRS